MTTPLELAKHKLKILQADLATETRSSEKLQLEYDFRIKKNNKILKQIKENFMNDEYCYKFNVDNVLKYLNIESDIITYDIDSLKTIAVSFNSNNEYLCEWSEEDIENSLFRQLMVWIIHNNIVLDGAKTWILKNDFHQYYKKIWEYHNSKFPIYKLEIDKILKFLNIDIN